MRYEKSGTDESSVLCKKRIRDGYYFFAILINAKEPCSYKQKIKLSYKINNLHDPNMECPLHLMCQVDDPTRAIKFTVVFKPGSMAPENYRLESYQSGKKHHGLPQVLRLDAAEVIEDGKQRSISHVVHYPKIGYTYRLVWDERRE